MTIDQILIGGVVRLRSGGVPMVVASITVVKDKETGEKLDVVNCRWWSHMKEEPKSGQFFPSSLVPA